MEKYGNGLRANQITIRKTGVLKKGGVMLGSVLLAMLALWGCRKVPSVPGEQVYVMAGESLRLQKESQIPGQEEFPEQEKLPKQGEFPEQEEHPGQEEPGEQEGTLEQEELLEQRKSTEQTKALKEEKSQNPDGTAPASEEETTAVYVCVLEEEEIRITDTITLFAQGDRVIRMKDRVEVDLTAFDDEINEMFAEMFVELQEEFQTMEGVTIQAFSEGKIYTLELFAEFEGKTWEEISEEGLLTIEGDGEEISLEEAGRLLVESGYERADEMPLPY